MEHRIASLLGDATPNSDKIALESISLPSLAPRKPSPVEPSHVGDDGRSNNNTTVRRSEYENLVGEHYSAAQRPVPCSLQTRGKSGVPLAEVLNNEEPRADQATAPEPRFSGRLSDILLDSSKQDPSTQHPNKRRKVDDHSTPPALPQNENNPLKLPKLPQLPKKTTRRPRIPPLLQGLHQPPPLPPEGRLFPPITGEASGFGRNIGERVSLRTADEEKNRRTTDTDNRTGGESSGPLGGKGTAVESEQEKTKRSVTFTTSDKENQSQGSEEHKADKGAAVVKTTRKRNKWSEQETRDLLLGVKKFGIGNWKKILDCEDFSFDQRSAVDLKDRFRICCPGQGLKQRKPKSKAKGASEVATPEKEEKPSALVSPVNDNGEGPSQESPATVPAPKQKQPRKPRADTHKKGPAELAEMGITGTFEPSKRRQRREFTKEDDKNLLKGFEKYRASWLAIREDKDLGFDARHPTDLRDRFRIRYPEKYQKAGFKLKPKEELLFPKADEEHGSASSSIRSKKLDVPPRIEIASTEAATATSSTTPSSSTSNLRAHALRQPLLNSFPSPFEDFPDIGSEDDDGERGHSPITLNRNIFQWADANPSQTNAVAACAYQTTGDAGFNLFAGMDGIHINPLATMKLPAASLSNSAMSGMPSYPPTSNPLALSFPNREAGSSSTNMTMASMMNLNVNFSTPSQPPTTALAMATSTTTAATAATTSSKNNMASLLLTPNLPTIVYPHVPAASARNAMHNLPPPADLLSGLDLDPRSEQQSQYSGYLFEDGMSSTLAPLMGQGRNFLSGERERERTFEEVFGERRR